MAVRLVAVIVACVAAATLLFYFHDSRPDPFAGSWVASRGSRLTMHVEIERIGSEYSVTWRTVGGTIDRSHSFESARVTSRGLEFGGDAQNFRSSRAETHTRMETG